MGERSFRRKICDFKKKKIIFLVSYFGAWIVDRNRSVISFSYVLQRCWTNQISKLVDELPNIFLFTIIQYLQIIRDFYTWSLSHIFVCAPRYTEGFSLELFLFASPPPTPHIFSACPPHPLWSPLFSQIFCCTSFLQFSPDITLWRRHIRHNQTERRAVEYCMYI